MASRAEMQNLKSQLNPHFLFNTPEQHIPDEDRSGKSADDHAEPEQTLRYVLYDENQERVSLDKELAFTLSYIELMSLRLTDKTSVRVNIPEDTQGLTIAPLMFISQVENAFKHGVSQTEPSFIDIDIEIKDHTLRCSVKNSYFPKEDSDYSGSGIGIENLQRRLSLIYPGNHSFTHTVLDNVYVSELTVNL